MTFTGKEAKKYIYILAFGCEAGKENHYLSAEGDEQLFSPEKDSPAQVKALLPGPTSRKQRSMKHIELFFVCMKEDGWMGGWEAGSPASCFLFPLPPIILSLKKKLPKHKAKNILFQGSHGYIASSDPSD